jgi:hypothetical protein
VERVEGLWVGGAVESTLISVEGLTVGLVTPEGWKAWEEGGDILGYGSDSGYPGKLAVEAVLKRHGVSFDRDWTAEVEYLRWWISKLAVSVGLPVGAEVGDVVKRATTRWSSDGPMDGWEIKRDRDGTSAEWNADYPAATVMVGDGKLIVGIEKPEDADRRKDLAWTEVPLSVVFKILNERDRGAENA